MLFASASCQQEIIPDGVNGDAVVSLSVAVPDAVTKAVGDGTNVDYLYYEIWSDNNGALEKELLASGKERTAAKTFDLELTLVSDQTYHFLFWAQCGQNNSCYDVTDLTKVKVNYDNAAGNDESRAAFFAYKTIKVEGAVKETIYLKRPFAQLNFGTSTLKSSFMDEDVKVSSSTITVKKPATVFDLVNGVGGTPAANGVVFTAEEEFKLDPTTLSVSDKDYNYLSMNYFLVEGETGTVNVDAEFVTDFGTVSHEFTFVPVAENYRTNIVGDLLFNKADFEIIVDEKFNDQDNEYEGGKYGVLDGKRYVKVEDAAEFNAAFVNANIDMIILLNDLELTETLTKAASDHTLTISAGKELILDLNGKKLSATSSQTGKNYNMFDVRGTLTVKNGTIEYQHTGSDMGWNNFAEIFYVGFNGTLNLEGVNAENKGGSAMAYVVDMVNATNITVNVDNSTLKSTYIPIRVFNNSKTGVNNVTIKNSTLDGKYCFWVQYYLSDGRDEETLEKTLKLDIFNSADGEGNNNTFTYTNDKSAPVLFGFNEAVYFDANGTAIVYDAEELAAILTSDKENIAVSLGADIDLPITSLGQQTGGSGEYKLGGENTKAITIDLNGKNLNITTTYWSALGAKNDNALVTIKNGTMTSTGNSAGTWNAWDLRFSNCNYAFEVVTFEKAVALDNVGRSTSMKNVTITDTHNTDTYGLWITAEGQTVTLEDCVIDMTPASDGRGIKIDEQYVSDADKKKVTLNVKNVTFKTDEKAAILVKSAAGAEINASELDITNVAEDTEFAVWVDEDAAAYADKVVVTGALKKVEGSQGLVVESPAELAETTIQDNATVVLSAGTYVVPASAKGKTVTFIGTGDPEDVQVAVTKVGTGGENCDYGLDGSNVVFENITITTNSSTYIGYARCNGTYNNCIINGTYTLYGNSVFNNCTLNVSGDVYNIWTWGAPTAVFNNCTFNSDGKAMLLYGTENTKLTVNECTFNDNGGLTDKKAAIETGNDYNKSYELIVNETIVNGYEINDKGINTGTTLWANKNSMPQDKLNVVVDGVDVY